MKTADLRTLTTHGVQQFLELNLEKRISEAAAVHPSFKRLWETARDLTLEGGKRFRPYLTMVGYGSYSEAIVPIAAAQELLHVAMLIHDDVIDEDDIRRGRKNINGHYKAIYGRYVQADRAQHYAYSASIMAGDAFLSEALRYVSSAAVDPAVLAVVVERFHHTIFEVIGGEFLDIEASFVSEFAYDPLQIYRYKTAGYSFIGPLLCGALCAKTSQTEQDLLEAIGLRLGVAFQLQDDLLGIFGDESEIGKTVLLDLKEAKATYLIARHRHYMNKMQQTRFEKSFGNASATPEELRALRDDLVASGAFADTEKFIAQYFDEAKQLIEKLHHPQQRSELIALTETLEGRVA